MRFSILKCSFSNKNASMRGGGNVIRCEVLSMKTMLQVTEYRGREF